MEKYTIIGYTFAAVILISGGFGTLYRVIVAMRKEREHENKEILSQAKGYTDLKSQTLQQELNHQKDMHEGKISELSDKIDQLKEEMSKHHTQLMDFLIKSIDKK